MLILHSSHADVKDLKADLVDDQIVIQAVDSEN